MPAAAPLPHARRGQPPIFWILIGLLAILLIVGIGSIAYYIKLTYSPAPALWERPWDMPEPERISAGLAVWSLSGAPSEQVYRAAMAADELDTAAALALLTPHPSFNQQLGWIQTLSHRFIVAEREPDAQVFLQYTADMALALPELPDYLRAQTLMQTADDWAELKNEEKADWALTQALLIAQFSPQLTPALRKALLTDIGERVIALGDTGRGQAISAIPVLAYTPFSPPDFSLTPILQQPLAYPEGIISLQKERQLAAQHYVDDWSKRGGRAAAGATRRLAAALIDEDLGRQVYYQNQLAREDLAPEQRLRISYDQVGWLAIKYRAASGLYGAPLTPEWSDQRQEIGTSLRHSIMGLHDAMNEYAATLPPEQAAAAKVAMDRLLVGWAVIGLYEGENLDALTNALNQDIAAWETVGVFPKAKIQDGRIEIELFYKEPVTKKLPDAP